MLHALQAVHVLPLDLVASRRAGQQQSAAATAEDDAKARQTRNEERLEKMGGRPKEPLVWIDLEMTGAAQGGA